MGKKRKNKLLKNLNIFIIKQFLIQLMKLLIFIDHFIILEALLLNGLFRLQNKKNRN